MDRDTGFLLPPDVRDWLPEGHLAWTVIDAVEMLDLTALISTYRLGGRGRRAYDPAMMLTLLIYAYAVGLTSSRGIERACGHDVAFRVITANQVPDHDTIAAFRVRHREVFKDLFIEVLKVCAAAGLGRVGTISVDGSKIAANASSRRNRTAAGIAKAQAELGEPEPDDPDLGDPDLGGPELGDPEPDDQGLAGVVEDRLERAESSDAAEDAEHGPGRRGDEPPEDMNDPTARRARLARAAAKVAEQNAARAAEAAAQQQRYETRLAARNAHHATHGRFPKGRPPKAPATPTEAPATPTESTPAGDKPVRANTTDPDSRPLRTAQGFLQGFNSQAVVGDDQVVIAVEVVDQANDAGLLAPMTAAALDNLARAGIDAPVETVLADTGYFTAGDITALDDVHQQGRGPRPLVPPTRDALRDPEQQQPPRQESRVRRRMRERLAEPEARERYRRRKVTVEPVFGQIKNRIADRFRVRGLVAVRAELTLIATAHNLLKLHTATT
ncbi:transposase [Actinomycetospora corticicola]|uniref:Transposase n=1 Tax=Actinomycetospora corticicola TaxID=663602 RepID=A0A7Y9DSH4_9PSEU|nr:transposase [Actinomycetospora corticicola]